MVYSQGFTLGTFFKGHGSSATENLKLYGSKIWNKKIDIQKNYLPDLRQICDCYFNELLKPMKKVIKTFEEKCQVRVTRTKKWLDKQLA